MSAPPPLSIRHNSLRYSEALRLDEDRARRTGRIRRRSGRRRPSRPVGRESGRDLLREEAVDLPGSEAHEPLGRRPCRRVSPRTAGERGVGLQSRRGGRSAAPPRIAARASRLCRRIRSWRTCRSPPARTPRIRISSVAMKGSSARRRAAHDGLVHDEPARDVRREPEDRVGGEEALGQEEPAGGRVVERALEPLRGGRLRRPRARARGGTARATSCARSAWGCACTPWRSSRSARPRTARRARSRPRAGARRSRSASR